MEFYENWNASPLLPQQKVCTRWFWRLAGDHPQTAVQNLLLQKREKITHAAFLERKRADVPVFRKRAPTKKCLRIFSQMSVMSAEYRLAYIEDAILLSSRGEVMQTFFVQIKTNLRFLLNLSGSYKEANNPPAIAHTANKRQIGPARFNWHQR